MAKILIVDDARFVRAVLARVLTRAGHNVAHACDGAEALADLSKEPYDLVLLDLDMPVLDGFDLLRQLQQLESRPKTIVMTGDPARATIGLCRQLGADGYLSKPAYGSELLATIEGLLGETLLAPRASQV